MRPLKQQRSWSCHSFYAHCIQHRGDNDVSTASMANTQQTQAFYGLTLEPPSAPTAAVLCNVIPGLKAGDQQIFEARGSRIALHRITENSDRTERKITTVLEQDVFGIVRGVSACKVPGTSTGQYTLRAASRARIVIYTPI